MIGSLGAALLRAWCAPRAARFSRTLDNCELAQRQTLSRLTTAMAQTGYGRSFDLRMHDDPDAFRAKLPTVDYADMKSWIDLTRSGRPDVLTRGRISHFEPTSGSGGANKLIPYNRELRKSFQSLFAIWAHDLLGQVLNPRSGRVFVSISPPSGPDTQTRHDADYLSDPMRLLVSRFLVSPRDDRRQVDPVSFRDALALALLHCPELEIISIWSPTYLLVLLNHIETRREFLRTRLPVDRRHLLDENPLSWPDIWPRLQLISCWTAAAASSPAQQLARSFPHALLQGKGLLATEAPLTVPLIGAGGCVPLIDEVFIELEDHKGTMHLLHEAQPGRDYGVLVSQAAGLMRYRLGDRVRVTGYWRDTPLLEFNGRADAVSDLVGEKLTEQQVFDAWVPLDTADAFALLVPITAATPRCYGLITNHPDPGLAERLDTSLQVGHRYREARLLGQLTAPRAIVIPDARRIVHDFLIADGMLAGDIKDTMLLHSADRADRLLEMLQEIGHAILQQDQVG